MDYRRVAFTDDIEKRILTGMIISDSYLQDISLMIDPKFFKIDYIRKIVKWVMEYYREYRKAPSRDFESIFYAKTEKVPESEAELMEYFLQELSDQYIIENEENTFNKALLFNQTVEFCKDRSLEILQKTIEGHRLNKDFKKAEEALADYGKIANQTSQWFNPFETEEIYKTFEEEEQNRLFKMPGALGDLMGYFQRGWMIGIMAPTKRGKSFFEWEIAFQALVKKFKVVIFSFEMNKTVYKKRIYKRMTAMAETAGEYIYPVFDCMSNQDNTCKKPERTNSTPMRGSYSQSSPYKPCVACRGSKDYFAATWFNTQKQEDDLNPDIVDKKVKAFKKYFKDNLRIRCFPTFVGSMDDAIAELESLERQGFYADFVLWDYIDITAPELADELEDENRKWKRAKGLAGQKMHCAINCHQGNRDSDEATNIKQKHTGGNIKKLHHLDRDITINQFETEKKKGYMRTQILVDRHEGSSEKGEVIVLQSFQLGLPLIDSEWRKNKRKATEE